jgi:hypothetical protein
MTMGIMRDVLRAVKSKTRVRVRKGNEVKTTVRVRALKERTTTTVRRPQGLVLYRGTSLLDGSPIAVVAVGLARRSKNGKTGQMVQVYVLADGDESPIDAVKSGADAAVCGSCPLRGKSCYVNVAQAPLSIYRAVKRGSYPMFHPPAHLHLFVGRHIRFGAYGDPAAVPLRVWRLLANVSAGWTGYTHQWRTCNKEYRRYLMASCETALQREQAVSMGWRTFRARLAHEPLEQGEFSCPASAEEGRRLTCEECGACDGAKPSPRAASPSIIFHAPDNGAGDWMRSNYEHTVARLHAEEEAASRRVSLPLAG